MTFVGVRRTGVFLSLFAWACLSWATGVGRAADGASLKEESKKVDDITVTSLNLDVKTVLPCLLWADAKGSAFLVLDGGSGLLRRVSTADFTVVKEKDLGRKMTWLSPFRRGVATQRRQRRSLAPGRRLLRDQEETSRARPQAGGVGHGVVGGLRRHHQRD